MTSWTRQVCWQNVGDCGLGRGSAAVCVVCVCWPGKQQRQKKPFEAVHGICVSPTEISIRGERQEGLMRSEKWWTVRDEKISEEPQASLNNTTEFFHNYYTLAFREISGMFRIKKVFVSCGVTSGSSQENFEFVSQCISNTKCIWFDVRIDFVDYIESKLVSFYIYLSLINCLPFPFLIPSRL